jgi:hypothetical protein
MSIELTGGCQCGAIRYRARVASNAAYYCHCRMCQRAFGNVFATFFNVSASNVAWERGEPKLFRSSKLAHRGFCAECGTPLSFQYDGAERIDLSVGSLDDPRVMRPAFHLCVESRLDAFHTPDGLPEHAIEESADYQRSLAAAGGVPPAATSGRGAS